MVFDESLGLNLPSTCAGPIMAADVMLEFTSRVQPEPLQVDSSFHSQELVHRDAFLMFVVPSICLRCHDLEVMMVSCVLECVLLSDCARSTVFDQFSSMSGTSHFCDETTRRGGRPGQGVGLSARTPRPRLASGECNHHILRTHTWEL